MKVKIVDVISNDAKEDTSCGEKYWYEGEGQWDEGRAKIFGLTSCETKTARYLIIESDGELPLSMLNRNYPVPLLRKWGIRRGRAGCSEC